MISTAQPPPGPYAQRNAAKRTRQALRSKIAGIPIVVCGLSESRAQRRARMVIRAARRRLRVPGFTPAGGRDA